MSLPDWDGSLAHAVELRRLAAGLPVPRGRPSPGGRGLRKALGAYGKSDGVRLIRWLASSPEEIDGTAALIGDPALAPWPWSDADTVSEEDALAGLTVLSHTQVAVDVEMERFLRVFFRERRRRSWMTAARALALQALRHEPLSAHFDALWADFAGGVRLDGGGNRRLFRHLLYLGFCRAARGFDVPGLDPVALLAGPLTDDADWSVLVCGVGLLLADRPALDEPLARVAESLGSHPLTERALVQALSGLPEERRARFAESLSRPRWSDVEGLLAHRDTLRALGAAPSEDPLDLDGLLEHLRWVFDPARASLLTKREHAERTVRLVEAAGAEAHATRSWPALARSAGITPLLDGPLGEVGSTAIAVQSALAARPIQVLLRQCVLPSDAWLSLAPSPNPMIATQVAIQAERSFRSAVDDSARVRLLWRLLVADPPREMFDTLIGLVRADTVPGEPGQTPFIQLIRAVSELDHLRDTGGEPSLVAEALVALNAAVRPLLQEEARPPLEALARAVRMASENGDDPAAPLQVLSDLLTSREGGLLRWVRWVDGDLAEDPTVLAGRAQDRLTALTRALDALVVARPQVEPRHAGTVREAARGVRVFAQSFGWPERYALERVLDQLETATSRDLEAGYQALEAARSLQGALVAGDEEAVRRLVSTPTARALLTTSDLQRTHRFLLDQLLWTDATRLRGQVMERVGLPATTAHLLPIFAAVAGGSLLVLDFGDAWLTMAGEGVGARYLATLLLTLILSFLILQTTLSRQLLQKDGAVDRSVRRALPVFGAALATSLISATVVAATLGTVPLVSLPLFTALTLFLGVFVGLILQGRPVTSGQR